MPIILIIDDDQDIRKATRTVLSREGYTVLDESSANGGIAAARRQTPDLILMDVNLPTIDGWTATRVIKSDPALAHIPIVAWTLQVPDGEVSARAAGYDGYLAKPLDVDSLGRQIQAWLNRPSDEGPASSSAPDPLHLQHLQDRLRHRQADLEALYRASQVLSASLDPSVVLRTVLEQAVTSVGATGGGLYLLDAHRQPTDQMHMGDLAHDLPKEKLKAILESGAASWAIGRLGPAIIDDTFNDRRWVKTEGERVRSALIVPLVGRDGLLGVLLLNHDQVGHFTQEHLALLTSLTAQAAIALDNARLYDQARSERQKLLAILDSSADAVIVTDTEGNITMVNVVAGRLLGLRPDAVGRSVKALLASSPLAALFELVASRGEPVGQELEIQGIAHYASVRPVPGIGSVALLQDIHLLRDMEKMDREEERRETERIRREFTRHMSPQVVRLLLKRGESLAPRKCKAAVLITDLRNYTNLTERIGVEAIMEYVLKRYIAVATDVVYANGGTIDNLMGDGILAVFGVPFSQADAPQRALSTAILVGRALATLREGWLRDLDQDITVGMGLAWGDVIAGNIGSTQRVDYTVIGDPVNMASRLASMAAAGEILLSQALAEAVGGDSPEWHLEALPPVSIKGKQSPQVIYRAVPTWPET
jgi:adenylate cyclase